MRDVGYESYLNNVANPIEFSIEDVLFEVFNQAAEHYGFKPATYDEFHSYYWDGYVGEFRSLAIKLFEWLGMDVEDTTGEWK